MAEVRKGQSITCASCGTEFQLAWCERYVVRDKLHGVATGEPRLYDAFDCPTCGCQNVVNERRRRLTIEETGSVLPMPRMCCLDPSLESRVPEWPRFEDGDPVLFGDRVLDSHGHGFVAHSVSFSDDGWAVISSGHGYSVRVKGHAVRPTDGQMADYLSKWPGDSGVRNG